VAVITRLWMQLIGAYNRHVSNLGLASRECLGCRDCRPTMTMASMCDVSDADATRLYCPHLEMFDVHITGNAYCHVMSNTAHLGQESLGITAEHPRIQIFRECFAP